MIFRLIYCNKFGNQARVEIQKGLATPIFDIEGTGKPFILSYQNDKSDKRGAIRSSSADIEIYETPEFNIDVLKTSNETELSVTYFVDNVVKWKGFIIPDFFSREISGNAVVSMTASDRLGTLKSATLSDLASMMTLRDLTIACLTKTGLSLSLKTMVDISNGTNNNDFFNSKILTQRLSDTKGRNISCYDVLSSILTASNSFLTQRNGEWYIVNKYQHEIGSGKLYNTATTSTNWSEVIHDFSEITVGGRRTIVPVGSSVGVYQEFGGGRIHPENYDFSQDLTGWSSVGGFVASIDNRKVDTFTTGVSGQAEYKPVYGAVTEKKYLVNFNEYLRNENPIYLESNAIPVFYSGSGSVTVSLDINAVGPAVSSFGSFPPAYLRVAIIATNGTKTKTLDYSGKFIDYPSTNPPVFTTQFDKGEAISSTIYRALSKGMAVSGALEVEDDLSLYNFKIRIYGGGGGRTVLINSVGLTIKSGSKDNPKGTIYKSEQGSNFTKTHDLETSIFGDYLTNGLNGYFYDYPKDDTSSLFNNAGALTSNWTTPTDTEELPLLQHISRQKARMFSVAHDLLTAEIEVVNFDPLAIFRDCKGKKYTIVTAEVDFFNARVNLDIEQIIYDGAISRRDFVYSYFGDGEKGVQSIGGVSAGSGGGGTGGGLTSEQLEIINNLSSWWKVDEQGNLYSDKNVYSKLNISAFGMSEGGSEGGGVNLLQTWADYEPSKDNWAVKAGLLVPFYNDTKSRLTSLEGGAALSLSTVGTGNGIANITKSGTALTATKGNFAQLDTNGKIISSQLPSYVDDVLEFATLANFPVTGESGKIYISVNTNLTYRWSGTAYVPISSSLALGETAQTAYRGDRGKIAYDHSQTAHQAVLNGTGFVKVSGTTISYDNNSYSLSSHNHSGIYEPIFSKNSAFNKNFGNTVGTVTQGNDSRLSDARTPLAHVHAVSDITGLSTSISGKLDKAIFEDLFEKVEISTGNWAIKAKYNFFGVGNISAYGFDSSGGGGGESYNRLDTWASYDGTKAGWVLSAFLGKELDTRVINLESGSALTVNTTGAGNAITSISKAGSVVTANKDLTFSLAGHSHPISDITNLQTTLNGKLETSIFNTHNTDNIRHITGAERAKWDGAVTNLDNLEIGGRNYAIGFGEERVVSTGTSSHFGVIPVKPNDYVTVSFYVKGSSPFSGDLFVHQFHSVENPVGTSDRVDYQWLIATIGTEYTYHEETIKIPDNSSIVSYTLGQRTPAGIVVTVCKIKLEKGTIPTDWTPAPEDQVSDWLTTDVNSFSFIKNKPTSLSQFTDNIGVATHIANTSNPHLVTKAQVGLGNVDNTSDLLKPISTATQTALNLKANLASPTFTGVVTVPKILINKAGNTASGISWYNSTYNAWQDYMASSGVSGNGVGGNITAPTGTLVTSWARRSFIENGTGQGWTFESGTYMSTTPLVVAEIRASDGAARFTGNVTAPTFSGALSGNADTATKLGTSRTIWGQSFDGTGNVSGAMSGVTTLAMTGALSGATTIAASTSVTVPKVIFAAAGWSMEQVGSELQLKHNGTLKQRFLNDGTIVAMGNITAFN